MIYFLSSVLSHKVGTLGIVLQTLKGSEWKTEGSKPA